LAGLWLVVVAHQPGGQWADLISGNKELVGHWRTVFDHHPEFFRKSHGFPDNYALVWRRALQGRYHRREQRMVSWEEYETMSQGDRDRLLNRAPVPEGQIKTLLDTAINLHQRESNAARDWQWWVAPVIAAISSFVGAILGWAPQH
jgi:hypothetical protein